MNPHILIQDNKKKRITLRDVLYSYTSQGLQVEDIDTILKNCNFKGNMPWDHVKNGRWPPFTNQSNFHRLQLEIQKIIKK